MCYIEPMSVTLERLFDEVRHVATVVAEVRQGLTLMNETVLVLSMRMENVERACTAEHPPSPLVEPLQELAAAVAETTMVLRDIRDSIDDQPSTIQAMIEAALCGKSA